MAAILVRLPSFFSAGLNLFRIGDRGLDSGIHGRVKPDDRVHPARLARPRDAVRLFAAVITGFLFTAIPNWTGRLPLRGRPLMFLAALWIAGRICVTFSVQTGWLAAMLVDTGFLLLVGAAAAREIVAGRKWNNLSIVVLILVLLAGNVAFHLEAHFNASAEIGIRVGIGVIVLLISLIGGRIIPSFT